MRLKFGSSVRVVLNDGTALIGTVRASWRIRVLKLVEVRTHSRQGEVQADGYMLVPARSVLFIQVEAG